LERDAQKAPELAERLKLTSADLVELGIVDQVVPELDPEVLAKAVASALDQAEPGERTRRIDAATARWLR
jgi:acetyl-CoA carboxylase alpha subunit